MKIILASGSPRRAKILRDLGVDFAVVKSDAAEVAYPRDPERTVRENALAKGALGNNRISESLNNRIGEADAAACPILSADTIVWFNGKIYGKPRDLDEAKAYLRTLSGQTHTVFTGVALTRRGSGDFTRCVSCGSSGRGAGAPADSAATAEAEATGGAKDKAEVKVVRSEVKFRELSDAMIDEYVARVKPTDRAGAYDIDESGNLIVESYTGSYENIMGLPVEPLREWGIVHTTSGLARETIE